MSRVLNGKPGVVGVDARGGADGARRARLRAADQAARRARPAGRPRAARAAEPDLPRVRRGGRRGAGAAGLHPGAVHADRRRRLRGRLRRAPARAAGVGHRLRRRPLRAARRRRTATTSGSPGATCRSCSSTPRSRSCPSRGCPATTRWPSSRRSGTWPRSATRRSAWSSGPVDHVPSERKLRAAQAITQRLGLELGERQVVRSAYSLESGQAAGEPAAARGRHRHRLRERPAGARRDPGRPAGRAAGPGRHLGRRLRRLRLHELHRAAADHGPPADRADGPGGDRPAGQPDPRRASCRRTSCSSSRSSSCAAPPGPRRRSRWRSPTDPGRVHGPRPAVSAGAGPVVVRRHLSRFDGAIGHTSITTLSGSCVDPVVSFSVWIATTASRRAVVVA